MARAMVSVVLAAAIVVCPYACRGQVFKGAKPVCSCCAAKPPDGGGAPNQRPSRSKSSCLCDGALLAKSAPDVSPLDAGSGSAIGLAPASVELCGSSYLCASAHDPPKGVFKAGSELRIWIASLVI